MSGEQPTLLPTSRLAPWCLSLPHLQDANQLSKLLNVRGISAAPYHAGRDHRERSAVEQDFAAGRLRVVAATVAFGMGIDIAAVGGVIHATMPRSLEEYVQQVGRAGRDGRVAHCYAFLDDSDFVKLRSLAFSGVLDLDSIRGFLQAVFAPTDQWGGAPRSSSSSRKRAEGRAAGERQPKLPRSSAAGGGKAHGNDSKKKMEQQQSEAANHAAAPGAQECPAQQGPAERRFGVLPSAKLSGDLDMREESMEAILSYLQADTGGYLRMLPSCALSVKVSFYAAKPEQLAEQYPVVQVSASVLLLWCAALLQQQ